MPVPQPPAPRPPMPPQPEPPFDSIVRLRQDGWEGVPDGPNPFYVGAKDGLYVHRRMMIGRGLARVPYWPDNWPSVGSQTGLFNFEAQPVPQKIMAQVCDFFKTVYERQHTEAAVLLTMHHETGEWRVYVPTQLVSHGGVNYVFDPQTIQFPWIICGSIHSHCDFGAGHSGTDTGDAENFDGLHMTIGHNMDEVPQIVAMVAMNKKFFHYKPDQFKFLFEWENVRSEKAPDWWYRYVENTTTKEKPKGFDLYAKFDKSTVIKPHTPSSVIKRVGEGWGKLKQNQHNHFKHSPYLEASNKVGFDATEWIYSSKAGRMIKKTQLKGQEKKDYDRQQAEKAKQPSQHIRREFIPGYGVATIISGKVVEDEQPEDEWDAFFRVFGDGNGNKSPYAQFTAAEMIARGYRWDADEKDWVWNTAGTHPSATRESTEFNERQSKIKNLRKVYDEALLPEEAEIRAQGDIYWEDTIPKPVVDALIHSGCVADDDVDFAVGNPIIAGEVEYWQGLLLKKAQGAIDALKVMGVNAYFGVYSNPPKDFKAELIGETKLLTPGDQPTNGVH